MQKLRHRRCSGSPTRGAAAGTATSRSFRRRAPGRAGQSSRTSWHLLAITSANSNNPQSAVARDEDVDGDADHVEDAALRQYLLEGWYPSGTKGGSNPKVPSGALMKAMLINSAVTLGGTYQQNQQLGPGTAPGNVQATPPDPNRALARPRLPAAPF